MTWTLLPLAEIDPAQARDAHVELAAEAFSFLPFFDPAEDWGAYLARITAVSSGTVHVPGLVPWTDLYGVVDGALVGRVSSATGSTRP